MFCQSASFSLFICLRGHLSSKGTIPASESFCRAPRKPQKSQAPEFSSSRKLNTAFVFILLFASPLRIESNCVCADTSSAKVNSVKPDIKWELQAMCVGVCGAFAAATSDSLVVPFQHFSQISVFSLLIIMESVFQQMRASKVTHKRSQSHTRTHSAPVFAVNSLSRNDIASVATV